LSFGPQVKLIGGNGQRGDFAGVTDSGLPEKRFFDTAEAVVPIADGRIAFLEGGRGRIGVWSLPFVRPSAEPYRVPAEMMTGFKQARDMVAYKDGFLVSDAQAHQVFFVKSDGSKRVFAGTGVPGAQGEGGAASSAQLDTPVGLAVDSKGHAYIADSGNHAIRKVGDDGKIQTVAGALGVPAEAGSFKAGGSLLRFPTLIALDAQDTIHVYDGRFQIRRYAPTKQFDLVAGSGVSESYDPTSSRPGVGLGPVLDMTFGPDNLLYYADSGNHVIRRLDPRLPWEEIKAEVVVGSGLKDRFPYYDAAPLAVTVERPTALGFDVTGNLFYFEGKTFRWVEVSAKR
jgi:hypothetical protein